MNRNECPGVRSAKSDFLERILRVYPTLSHKKRRVADFLLSHYKKVFFMTAREIATACQVSEPTILRLTNDMGFSGYQEFVRYLKGLLHIELTGVERLLGTSRQEEAATTLETYCKNAVKNLQVLMTSVPEEDLRRVAGLLYAAEQVVVSGYRASATLAYYFGYMLRKIRPHVFIDMTLSWEARDLLVRREKKGVVFLVAFPRYPRKALEFLDYARKCGQRIVVLSDTPRSPVLPWADAYLLVDMEGVSFIDPFGHVLTFLGALLHEIAFMDNARAVENLALFDEGVRLSGEFCADEGPAEGQGAGGMGSASPWPDEAHREGDQTETPTGPQDGASRETSRGTCDET